LEGDGDLGSFLPSAEAGTVDPAKIARLSRKLAHTRPIREATM
jgi:hypothetical protein